MTTTSTSDVYAAILARVVDRRDVQLQSNAMLHELLADVYAQLSDVATAMQQLHEVQDAVAQLQASATQSTAAPSSSSYAAPLNLVQLVNSTADLHERLTQALSRLAESAPVEPEPEAMETDPSTTNAFPIILHDDRASMPERYVFDGASVIPEQQRESERQQSTSYVESSSADDVVTSIKEEKRAKRTFAVSKAQGEPALSSAGAADSNIESLHPSTAKRLSKLVKACADRAEEVVVNPESEQLSSALSAMIQNLKNLQPLFPGANEIPVQAHTLLSEMEKSLNKIVKGITRDFLPRPDRNQIPRLQAAISNLHVKCPGFSGLFSGALAKLKELDGNAPQAISEAPAESIVVSSSRRTNEKLLQHLQVFENAPGSVSIENVGKILHGVNGALGSSTRLIQASDNPERELESLQSIMRLLVSLMLLHRDKFFGDANFKLMERLLTQVFVAGTLTKDLGVRLTESRELLTNECVFQLAQLKNSGAKANSKKCAVEPKWLSGELDKIRSAVVDLKNWKTKGKFDTVEFQTVLQAITRVVKYDCRNGARRSDSSVSECLVELRAHTHWLDGKPRAKIEARIELLDALMRASNASAEL